MKKILLILFMVGFSVFFYPKPYMNYPGLVPLEVAKSWHAPTCIGITKQMTSIYPDGPNMWCYGIILAHNVELF